MIENKINSKFIFAGSFLMFTNTNKQKVSEKSNFKSLEYYGKYKIDAYKFISLTKKKYKIVPYRLKLFYIVIFF